MKIIFFDIDGTLIGGGTEIMSESTRKAINIARENGNLCFINTGRCHCMVDERLTSQVEFDGFLMGCGTEIICHNETLVHRCFSEKLAQRIIDGLNRYEIDVVYEASSDLYSKKPEEMYTEIYRTYVKQLNHRYPTKQVDAKKSFDKFFAYSEDKRQMDSFRAEFEDELEFVDRENGFYEVLPKGYSKATAIRFLVDMLHLSMEDTVAIGDSNNDLSMLECAHISIAMGNSSQAVLDMADYVTTDVMEDGIWNALKWLGVLDK